MATFTVDTDQDIVDAGDGLTSLREAVLQANAAAGADRVEFAASLAGAVLRLTQGEIEITDAVTIDGGGVITITGDANGDDLTIAGGPITDVAASGAALLDDNSRIFNVTSLVARTTLNGLTLTGGRTRADLADGGAVRSEAALTIAGCSVSGNSTTGFRSYGGGVYCRNTITLTDSRVSGNSTAGEGADGGGVFGFDNVTLKSSMVSDNSTAGDFAHGGGVASRSTVAITGSTVSDNSTEGAYSGGGGVLSLGSVTLTRSTVSGNSTTGLGADGGGLWGSYVTLTSSTVSGNSTAGIDADGGGMFGIRSMTLTNSTVSENSTAGRFASGGGVYGSSTVRLTSSTVSGNSTAGHKAYGGGIFGFGGVTLINSIVLGNDTNQSSVSSDEVSPSFLFGSNIVGPDVFDGATDVGDTTAEAVFAATVEIAPGVRAGVLALNGGPTETIALLDDPANPALDAADPALAPATDQRGFARPQGAGPDLGAFELLSETPSLVVTTALDVVDATDGLTSLREAVSYANLKAGADTVTFDASLAGSVLRLTRGEIEITDAVTIDGGGVITITGDAKGDDLTIAGGPITDVAASGARRLDDNSRIFNVTDFDAATTLDGLVLTGGRTTGQGGAVRSDSALTTTNSTVSGNSTTGRSADGGGIYGRTDVTLTNSTVSGNSTDGDFAQGGGLHSYRGSLTLTNSTVSGNSTAGYRAAGGGVSCRRVTLINSTVSGNSTAGVDANGSGVYGDVVTLTGSTVSGNSARNNPSGSGVVGYGAVMLTNSIVLGNGASGSGVSGPLTLVGGNIVGANVFDGPTDVGNTTADEVFSVTLEIAPGVRAGVLADNGGAVATIALLDDPRNPALDAGLDSLAAGTTDARGPGFARLVDLGVANEPGRTVDLGAFELQELPEGSPEAGNDAATTTRARPVTIDVLANDGDGGTPPLVVVDVPRGPEHGLVVALAAGGLFYLPDPGFAGTDTFDYTIANAAGLEDTGRVTVTVGEFPSLPMNGGAGDDLLDGDGQDETGLGNAGDDEVRGRGGDDVLWGGDGDDALLGGSGDDVLIGGAGSDFLQGLGGADLLVLDSLEGVDDIRTFSTAEGDRAMVAIRDLLLADGSLDLTRVRGIDRGNGLVLQADADGDGIFADLSIVRGAAGLALTDVLANAITIA